jgi:IS4 transposase
MFCVRSPCILSQAWLAYRAVEPTNCFRELEAGANGEGTLYYKVKEAYKPGRLCAIRKREEAEEKGVERLKVMKRHGKPPSEAQLANKRYVIVITSLREVEAELILQRYRFRRQIELVFKRLRTCRVRSRCLGIIRYRQK